MPFTTTARYPDDSVCMPPSCQYAILSTSEGRSQASSTFRLLGRILLLLDIFNPLDTISQATFAACHARLRRTVGIRRFASRRAARTIPLGTRHFIGVLRGDCLVKLEKASEMVSKSKQKWTSLGHTYPEIVFSRVL